MLEVHTCEVCGEGVAVKVDSEPRFCPYCGEETLSWSHDANEM